MTRPNRWSSFYSNYDNIAPGRWRGPKRGGRGKIKPSKFKILMERVPGGREDRSKWYKPFQSKPIKRRDKRGQSKPR